jgi:hypothetical protein
VRNIAFLLLIGGFFGGPISMVASMGYRPRWIFIEEFGEAVVFAIMAGYIVGVVSRMGGPVNSALQEHP